MRWIHLGEDPLFDDMSLAIALGEEGPLSGSEDRSLVNVFGEDTHRPWQGPIHMFSENGSLVLSLDDDMS